MMRLTRRATPRLLAGVLLALLVMLAILHYGWIGQLDDVARAQVQRDLQNAAAQFRVEFDRELALAFLSLQVTEGTASDNAESLGRYADRHLTWTRTALHPQLVTDVYLLVPGGDLEEGRRPTSVLRHWNRAAGAFVDMDWDQAPVRRWRERLDRALRDGGERDTEVVTVDDALLVGPLRALDGEATGLTVLLLDLTYIRGGWLPELAERYFRTGEGSDYRFAVVSELGAREVLYRTDAGAPLQESQAEVRERLFAREALDAYVSGEIDAGVLGQLPGGTSELGWSLLATYRGGPLEEALAWARFRNQALGSGILLLLAGSIGLFVVVSRREQRLARQQLDLVAGISHELRTPVSVIQAAAANLSSGVVEGDRVKTYGATIIEQAKRLGDMVEGALQFADIESNRRRLDRRVSAPAEIVEEAVAAARRVLPPEVTVEVANAPGLPGVLGDRDALLTALGNLIANAAKCGGADQWIGVRCEASGSVRWPEVRITVEDHGPGIGADERERIFEPFFRGSVAAERETDGSGLGLALVSRIAEAHGGRVTMSTAPGSGSTFTLHVPAAPEDAGRPAAASPSPPAL